MNGIFISHSVENRDLTELFIDLLQMGMGVGRERLFCSSLNGNLPSGEDFINKIKERIKKQATVLALITPEYLNSRFCMMELGAAWTSAPHFYPILVGSVNYADLDNTPLKSLQMRRIERISDLTAIYDEMVRQGVAVLDTQRFMKKAECFLKQAKEICN